MRILNALDIKNGARVEHNKLGHFSQPVQFLPEKEKDDDWVSANMDFYEWQGIQQIRRKAKRLQKNYKLSKGIIDKDDYIPCEDNEYSDLIEKLIGEDDKPSAYELKFFPIIPTIINVFRTEFSKRLSKIMFRTTDDLSRSERKEARRQEIEKVLLAEAEQKMLASMIEQGLDPESEEATQLLSEENLKTLPEIESFFRKEYKDVYEIWAEHQKNEDTERFHLAELEERAFTDMLITDSEFWHFKMGEDDYEQQLWNPPQVAYHKSPSVRYISDANWVTHIDLMTVADAIDNYGWMMTQEQLESLESIYPVRAAGYLVPGLQNDGSYYDATKSHEWNTQMPSLAMRQYSSMLANMRENGDIVEWILSDSEDLADFDSSFLVRVTTVYWKTQRKVGHLTKITAEGEIIQKVVTEDYKITEKPLYDTSFYKTKTKENLVFGEHIDWFWINEVWGGYKIGPNRPTYFGEKNTTGVNPIYIGLNGGKPGRIPFQFKGDHTLYGCKLPVEGAVFSDRNTRSISLVDTLKPYQIGFNLVNNQIADILIDELGTVILFDQNGLPKHSMGEDWGKANLHKAYLAMKNFQMLPMDNSLENLDGSHPFQHYQVLNLEQTNRLMSRISLANYFREQAYAAIGFTPERMGTPKSQQTAQQAEQNLNTSYAQTEMLFVQHCDYLMPRVHRMRTELSQFYHSKNPNKSIRLQYITSNEERVAFEMDGTDIMLRDINVHCSTKINSREIMEQFKMKMMNDNTTGASIYELGKVFKAESLAELEDALKEIELKAERARQQDQEAQMQQYQAELEQQMQLERERMAFEAEQNEKERQKDIAVAQIRAASSISLDTKYSDYDAYRSEMERIQKQQQHIDNMTLKREQEVNKKQVAEQQLSLKREELQTRREVADKNLQIARENQTEAELKARKKLSERKKKK